MRIEFLPDGSHDCPAILFHGCSSAGAEALIKTFRSLADNPATEVALHQLPDVSPVGDVQIFATNASGRTGVQQLSAFAFLWRQIAKVGLKPPSLLSRWPSVTPVKERDFNILRGTANSMLSFRLVVRGDGLLARRLSR